MAAPHADPGAPHTQNMIRVLTSISLTFGAISVFSSIFAFYWFLKMRRSFRHDLIMLLVQSDSVKSIIFVLFPIVNFIQGPVQSDSAFCQASGFFLALGIEAADVAVVLIALHAVMYIFWPKSGLYPYRRYAFAVYVLFPGAVASTAFVDGKGYENIGQYCYLRSDISWTRMALSWIPRYIICALLIAMYMFVYLYVRRRMDIYGRRSSAIIEGHQASQESDLLLAVPRIAYHGLIPPSPGSVRSLRRRQDSTSSINTFRLDSRPCRYAQPKLPFSRGARAVTWDHWAGFEKPSHSRSDHHRLLSEDSEDPLSSLRPSTAPKWARTLSDDSTLLGASSNPTSPRCRPSLPPLTSPSNACTHTIHTSKTGSYRRHLRTKSSLASVLSLLHKDTGNLSSSGDSSAISWMLKSPSEDLSRTRERTRRRLRNALFAYPVAYMCVWLFPFISHIRRCDSSFARAKEGGSSWLLIISMLSLSAQGVADVALFVARERPWRHARPGGSWFAGKGEGSAAGRTREEMLVDGRLARTRREGEAREERSRRQSLGNFEGQGKKLAPRLYWHERKGGRDWWDVGG